MGFSWFVGLSSIRKSLPAWQNGAGGRDVWAGRKTGAAEIARTCRGPSWLPGGLRHTDLGTKVHGALAAHPLRRARPGPSRVQQARDPPPNMPVRELGGIRPPVRDLACKALRPGLGFALHRSPWRTWVLALGAAPPPPAPPTPTP